MEFSKFRRLSYVIAAICAITLTGGVVMGWQPMRTMLKRETTVRPSSCESQPADQPCNEEELSFGLIFATGSWANQGGRLLVGIVLDRFGPRWTSTGCAVMCSIGALVFAMMSTTTGLAIGYFFIGMGGSGMQMSLQSVSTLFPKKKGLVMAMLSGAFLAASGVFVIFENVHRLADISLRTLMLIYASVLLLTAVASFIVWPMQPFGVKKIAQTQSLSDIPPGQTATLPCSSSSPSALPRAASHYDIEEQAGRELALNEKCFREQALSPEYLLITLILAFTVLQCQFTLGTIGMQFELKGDDGDLTRAFNLIFASSWVITPLIGHIIDRYGFVWVLVAMNGMLLCSSMSLLAPWRGLHFVTIVLYTFGRVTTWGLYFAFIGSVFGFSNFGKLSGGGLFVGGLFSLLQYPLLKLTLGGFDGDFTFVNCLFTVVHFALFLVIARLSCHLRMQTPLGPQGIPVAKERKPSKELSAHEAVHDTGDDNIETGLQGCTSTRKGSKETCASTRSGSKESSTSIFTAEADTWPNDLACCAAECASTHSGSNETLTSISTTEAATFPNDLACSAAEVFNDEGGGKLELMN